MRYLFIVLIITFSTAIAAQELVEFENGKVADADDLNQSLQFLLNKIEAAEDRLDQLEAPEYQVYTEVYGALALADDQLTFAAIEAAAAYTGLGITRGKHYWEVTAQCGPDTRGVGMGVVGADVTQALLNGSLLFNSFAITSDGGRLMGQETIRLFNGSFLSTQADDIFLIAIDLDTGVAFFGKNGVWEGGSNPSTGENPAFTDLSGRYHAFVSGGGRECQPNTFVTNFGASDFTYSVPSGYFKGYCPTNDCEVAD